MKSLAAVLLVAAMATPAIASAQQVSSRAQLQGLLGSSTIEGFEGFSLGSAPAVQMDVNVLDNTTSSIYGGPVAAGIRFSSIRSMQMNGPGYYGMPSHTLQGIGHPFIITFLNFTQGFGFDAMDYNGYASAYSASVYGPANALLGTMMFNGANAPATEFVGWYEAGGIDRVELTTNPAWTAAVDDVEFGTAATVATPEPASVVLLGTGLLGLFGIARRKRSA